MATKKRSARPAPKKIVMNLNLQVPDLDPDDPKLRKLPKPLIKTELEKLVIKLQKAKPGLFGDQRRRLVSSMGCVSNAGGPGC